MGTDGRVDFRDSEITETGPRSIDRAASLETLPPTRRAIIEAIKRSGDTRADAIAEQIGISVSGVRQHLTSLEAQGLVEHYELKSGPGRPRHLFRLTGAGESLFPRRYGDFAHQMLEFIGEESPELVRRLFDRRAAARATRVVPEIGDGPLADRLAALAGILDEDGYLATIEALDDGSFRLVEHNCALHDIAMRHRQACESEIEFLRTILPDTRIEREQHIVHGAPACVYRIRPGGPANA